MENNREALECILNALLEGKIETKNNFTGSLKRIATWSMPLIDYAYQDTVSGKTVAILFEQNCMDEERTRERLKAYTIKALNNFDAVVDAFDVKKLSEADFYVKELHDTRIQSLPIGVVVYDGSGNVSVLQSFPIQQNVAQRRTVKEQKSYWCWWRDASHYEVATLLELSFKYDNEDGDIYTNKVYPEFFNMMIEGKTRKWDGKPRNKTYSESSYKAEKQNYKIPMCQLGFWDAETGHITDKGLTLLDVVKTYGVESQEYFDCLAKIILIDGKHLDLVKDLDEFQKSSPEIIPENSSEFFRLFDEYMMQKNSIGTRKPTAITTGAKNAYVRDEPKLWNKLGIIKMQNTSRYYKPFAGIEFNWERINEILLSDVFGGKNE